MRQRLSVIVAAAAAGALIMSGCASTSQTDAVSPKSGSSATNAGTVDFCDWFPKASLPVPPEPAPTPYGDPADVSSFQGLASDVANTFGGMQRLAQYCSSGQTDQTGPIDPATCNQLYWGFQYADTPYSVQEMCNFMYLRADNSMWTTLTPKVLNQYGDYLGIEADGQNIPNLAAGPHVTLVSGGAVNAQFGSATQPVGSFNIVNGTFDAGSLNTAVKPILTSKNATFADGSSILPLIAGDTLTIDCSNVYTTNSGNTTVPLTSLPTTTNKFWCPAPSSLGQTNPTGGTAYVQISVVNPTASSAQFYATVPELGPTNSIMRKSGTSYDPSNIVLPIGTEEVSQFKTTQLNLPETCTNGTAAGSAQCLHIWVTKVKPNTSCVVWFVLEVDKSDASATLAKYGLSTSGFTAHISLGNNEQKNNWTACQRAQTLNQQMGLKATGNPPAQFLAQTDSPRYAN